MTITIDGTNGITFPNTTVLNTQQVRAQVFTSNGTFTVPAGVTNVKVTVVGGGGSGNGSPAGASNIGTGGGAGGASIKWISGLTPGSTVSVTVGSGGTAVASGGTNGNAGGTSSFGSYCSATGGSGGVVWTWALQASGGSGSSGDLNISGQSSTAQAVCTGPNLGGMGGNSIFGGGGSGGFGITSSATGVPDVSSVNSARAYGGGGGPSGNSGNSGAGYQGVVIVEY